MLLPPHLHTKALHYPQRRECVVDVPVGDAVLATTEEAHLHAALPGRNYSLQNHRIHKFWVLNPKALERHINDPGHLAAAVNAAPHQAHSEIGMEKAAVPVGLKASDHLLHHRHCITDDPVVTGLSEVFVAEVKGGN